MNLTFKQNPIAVRGVFPTVGESLPDFKLIKADLTELSREELNGKKIVFNIFPSIDTSVCALQLKKFSQELKNREDVLLVFVSLDLPFALKRFCAAEGIKNAIMTSDFRHRSLANKGLEMVGGPLSGLYARGVMVTDENLNIMYSELVEEVTDEPDYSLALKHL